MLNDKPKFAISDVFYDLLDLEYLLQATMNVIGEMTFVCADGSRNEELDIVYTMIRVAQREAARQREVASIFDKPNFVFPPRDAPVDKSNSGDN
jgi:hypothetical protein